MIVLIRNTITIFPLLFSLCVPQNYNSEKGKPDFRFESFSLEQGLSQGNVRYILQDRQGFLWLGTQDGLNRFDGYEFLVFKNVIGDSNSLSHNYIFSLAEDKDGNIWIATGGGGICRYNPYTNTFRRYIKDNNDSNLISVLCIFIDSDDQIWAGTYLVGLSRYDPEKDTFISFVPDSNDKKSISSNAITAIYEDKEGDFWLGSFDAGLIQFDRKKSVFKKYSTKDGLPSNYVTSICENKEGDLVLGTTNGLSIFNKQHTFTNYYAGNDPQSLSSNKIKVVFADKSQNIFVGTEDAGINYWFTAENTFYKYRTEDKTPFTISDNSIFSFYEDRSGIIWIGTSRGLNKIKNIKKFDILLGPESKEPLSGKNVWSIIEDSEGNVWAGTDYGVIKIDMKNRKEKKISLNALATNVESQLVSSLAEDKHGNIWIGSDSGLGCFNKQTNKLSTYYNNKGNDSYYYNLVRSIFIDDEIIWLGIYAKGIVKFDLSKKNFIPFEPSKGNIGLLNKYNVFNVYKDSKENYWFCTSVGLFQYKHEEDELVYSISTYDEESGDYTKMYNQSLCIYEDKDYFWIGTSGGGLIKFIPGDGFVKRYTEVHGLSNNVVYGILPDSSGNLWLSTNKGISKFNVEEETFKNYFIADGLPSDEFNAGSFLKASSGKLYFGGINGIVSFYPDQIKSNDYRPPAAITDFKVFDKPYSDKLYYSDNETIELSYQDNFFSFEFAALDFTNSKRNQYAYILEGFDNEWNYTGGRRFASYTNIDPGEYIFRVKGSNSDGAWNEKASSIKIIITPPFYRTWWAYSSYVAAFLIVLFSLRQFELNKRKRKAEAVLKEEREKAKLREAHLRAEKAELQTKAIESEKEIEKQNIRYRIASDLHDEIGSNLSSITLLSSILTKDLYEDGSPEKDGKALQKLTDINSAAKSSAESIRDIVWFINPMSDQLSILITRMKETASMMLGSLRYEIISDGDAANEKINPEVKRNIYLIYKEILNNIIKHSKADRVKISIKKEDISFILSVEDNGTGFSQWDVRRTPYGGFPDEEKIKTGNGLRNLRSRAEQINGELMINSVIGKGTEITLRVPM